MIILQAKHKNRGVFIYLNHVSNHATPKYKKAEKGKNESVGMEKLRNAYHG